MIIIINCFQENVNVFVKEKTMPEYLTVDIKIYSDYDREDSDEKNSSEET